MSADPGAFRSFFGSIPTAVALVTATAPDGAPQGFTCSAFAEVSAEPPLLLVCASQVSRTLTSLVASGAFVVHLLAEGGGDLGRRFAAHSGDKFEGFRWRRSEVGAGPPILEDEQILASAECTLARAMEMGDHTILVGRMESVQVYARRPVLYQRGEFTTWEPVGEAAVQT